MINILYSWKELSRRFHHQQCTMSKCFTQVIWWVSWWVSVTNWIHAWRKQKCYHYLQKVTPTTAVKFGVVQKGSEIIVVAKTLKDCRGDEKLYANVTITSKKKSYTMCIDICSWHNFAVLGNTIAGLISEVIELPLHTLCKAQEVWKALWL